MVIFLLLLHRIQSLCLEGTLSGPLFSYEKLNVLADLKEEIKKIVEDLLTEPMLFLVEVVIKGSGDGKQKVIVLLDGDEGINVETCAHVSRALGNTIEERDLISQAFTLEVSSPGLDHPLMSSRQYKKNVGRRVRVTLPDGTREEGKLLNATETDFEVAVEKKVDKKPITATTKWSYGQIEKTMVLVSFK